MLASLYSKHQCAYDASINTWKVVFHEYPNDKIVPGPCWSICNLPVFQQKSPQAPFLPVPAHVMCQNRVTQCILQSYYLSLKFRRFKILLKSPIRLLTSLLGRSVPPGISRRAPGCGDLAPDSKGPRRPCWTKMWKTFWSLFLMF